VAAGNEGRNNTDDNQGYATINAPANSPYVITVGAMNRLGTLTPYDDKITSYSSKGPTLIDHIVKPDLVPPGNRMYSMEANGGSMVQTYLNNRVAWSSYDSSKAASPSQDYFVLQWHVHDSSASKWNRCSSDPAGFNLDARSSEGPAHADCDEAAAGHHDRDGSGHGTRLHQRKRCIHGWCRIPECPSGIE